MEVKFYTLLVLSDLLSTYTTKNDILASESTLNIVKFEYLLL